MTFSRVIAILDEAIGGPGEEIGAHGAFWRDTTRDEFIELTVFGRPVVALGDGAHSNLVLALKGEVPFGSDLPDAPEDAIFRRMPAGLDPVPAESISVIEQWIDDDCPDDSSADATSKD